jgi:Tol biopolymer transport system component
MNRTLRTRARFAPLVGLAVLVTATSGCAYITRASNTTNAVGVVPANLGAYGRPALSANGRFVAYAAAADASVRGATTAIFRRDYQSQRTVRVDLATDGTPADGLSADPAISADGRYVAFTSWGDNLVAASGLDDNGSSDVFVHDMQTGTTTRVSVATDGTESDADSYTPSISADGRYVALTSDSDLLDPNDANGFSDVFVHDMQTGTTTLVSVATDGTPTDFGAWDGVISADGQHVAFTTDTDWATTDQNASDDIYMRDLAVSRTRRVSTTSTTIDGGDLPAISSDGTYVAYVANDGNVYKRTMGGGNTRVDPKVSALDRGYPVISGDGRWVAYSSAGNATGTDTNGSKIDVFLRDTVDGVTTVGSTTTNFTQLAADSTNPALSPDGHYLEWISAGAFDSSDTNGLGDVYVRAVAVPRITSVSPSTIARGTSATITVTGQGFLAPVLATVSLGGADVSVSSATWVSDTTVVLAVTAVSTATVGPQSVEVLNQGTGMGLLSGAAAQCLACLTVT